MLLISEHRQGQNELFCGPFAARELCYYHP